MTSKRQQVGSATTIEHETGSDAAITRAPRADMPSTKEQIVALLAELNAERQGLVQMTIERLTAGGAVDKAQTRRIRAIDAQKQRLLVARFVGLLRQNGPEIEGLVTRLMEI